jgi:Cu/Ag efflux protein CusF
MFSMRALCVATAVSVTAIPLKHGPIESLGITEGESTNDFKAKEPIMLKAVLPGKKIKFRADRVEGELLLTAIQLPG